MTAVWYRCVEVSWKFIFGTLRVAGFFESKQASCLSLGIVTGCGLVDSAACCYCVLLHRALMALPFFVSVEIGDGCYVWCSQWGVVAPYNRLVSACRCITNACACVANVSTPGLSSVFVRWVTLHIHCFPFSVSVHPYRFYFPPSFRETRPSIFRRTLGHSPTPRGGTQGVRSGRHDVSAADQ